MSKDHPKHSSVPLPIFTFEEMDNLSVEKRSDIGKKCLDWQFVLQPFLKELFLGAALLHPVFEGFFLMVHGCCVDWAIKCLVHLKKKCTDLSHHWSFVVS